MKLFVQLPRCVPLTNSVIGSEYLCNLCFETPLDEAVWK